MPDVSGEIEQNVTHHILIAEADVHVRELAKAFLTEAGYTVTFVSDGDEALARLAVAPPALLLTEIMLRKVDGLELCKRIKADPATRHVKVIVVSILAAAARSREAGADEFIKKPLGQRKLVDTVSQVLEGA
jgi:CheY-like chemotaxis protein